MSERTRRWWKRAAIAGGVLSLTVAVLVPYLTVRWFVHPRSVVPDRVDAVVVLAGGVGERLDAGMALIDAGVSDTLVLSTGISWFLPESRPVHALCAQPPPGLEVHCVAALPDSTAGEAEDIALLAEEQGWDSIALVTSSYHLTRSTRWFERCYDGALYPVSAAADTAAADIVHEWGGLVAQLLIDRRCG